MTQISRTAVIAALVEALAEGQLSENTTYYGVNISEYANRPVLSSKLSGWIFRKDETMLAASPIGAPRSAGVDKLRNLLSRLGLDNFLPFIPEFHVCDFWNHPDAVQTLDVPFRSIGLTEADAKNLQMNIVNQGNFLWSQGLAGIKVQYRGAQGTDYLLQLDWNPVMSSPEIGAKIPRFYMAQRFFNDEGNKLKGGAQALSNHAVYDTKFNAWTDEDITRYWVTIVNRLTAGAIAKFFPEIFDNQPTPLNSAANSLR